MINYFKPFILIIVVLTIFSCSPKVYLKYGEKSKKFLGIYEGKHAVIQGQDTIIFTEVKYVNKISSVLSSRAMFDNYGLWNNVVSDENSNKRILIWNKIDILKNGHYFNIATTGLENKEIQYTSFIITDTLNLDVLVGKSKLKDDLIITMRSLMDSVNINNKAFAKAYSPFFN